MFESFSKLPFPIFCVNSELVVLNYNKNLSELVGEINLKNHSLFEFISSEHNDDFIRNQFLSCKSSIEAVNLDFSIIDEKGGSIPFSWSVIYDSIKNNYILCGQNQAANQAIETRYERIYQSTSDAVMLLDKNRFTDCNKATLDVFKLNSVEDFIKFHPADLSPPFQPDGRSSLEKANQMIMKAMKEGKNFFEWVHRNSKGEDFPCEVLLSRLELHNKIYLQASVRDISERKKLQKELDEANVMQINASRLTSMGEMAGGIAHEINNPMAVIRSQAELLLKCIIKNRAIDIDIFKSGLERIINTSDRISRIIKGLKLLSRDSSEDPMISTDINHIIMETIHLCEEKLKEKAVNFNFESKENKLFVSCRSVEISQVILNLISNSIDAIELQSNPWIKIETSRDSNIAVIKLTDSGKGIPKEIAEKITLPFYTTKEVGKGSGLGLSITKKIVEKHHGEFYLDQSAENTTFYIKLPIN